MFRVLRGYLISMTRLHYLSIKFDTNEEYDIARIIIAYLVSKKGDFMPGYRGHLAGGAVTYGFLFFALHSLQPTFSTAMCWFFMTCAGALFPDIDIKSKGQKYFYWAILAFLVWSIMRFKQIASSERFDIVAGTAVLALIPLLVRHRGVTHQQWFIISMSCAVWMIMMGFFPHHARSIFVYLLFFCAGALSHIWLDRGLLPKRGRLFRFR
jgi:hypothetical protein